MTIYVAPHLEKVVQAAQEANVVIQDIQFIRNPETQDSLQGLTLQVDGNEDCKSYFNWLLDQSNLSCMMAV